jgi:hypothetical protein
MQEYFLYDYLGTGKLGFLLVSDPLTKAVEKVKIH